MNDGEQALRRLGRRVRLLRRARELTQEQLAAATGISRSFVSALEKGHAGGCDVLRVYRLADTLGVPVVDLLDGPTRDRSEMELIQPVYGVAPSQTRSTLPR